MSGAIFPRPGYPPKVLLLRVILVAFATKLMTKVRP